MTQDTKDNVPKTGHIYDGIEELDHPPPDWFRALFYGTIAFAVAYSFYYIIGEGPTLTQEYQRAKDKQAYAVYQHQTQSGGNKTLSEDDLKTFAKDPEKRKLGGVAFQGKCASCHGNQGQGGIGPNLTDRFWIHGGKLSEILSTVTKGVPEKGMPGWGAIVSKDELHALTAYIHSIAGTSPAGAKAPQGIEVPTE